MRKSLTRSSQCALRGTLAGGLLSLMLLLSACGGDASVQQQASQAHTQLTQTLQQALAIGVPSTKLASIQKQKDQLDNTHAPLSMFFDQSVTDYNRNLAMRYHQLTTETQGIISTTTDQDKSKAQGNMQQFQQALNRERNKNKVDVGYFSQKFNTSQTNLSKAQYPKDYQAISTEAGSATDTLNGLQPTFSKLDNFKQSITDMKNARLDTTAIQQQYQDDVQSLNAIHNPDDINHIKTMIDAQYQQAAVTSTQAIPYVGAARLRDFQSQIDQLKNYGIKTDDYEKKYSTDKTTLDSAKTPKDYQSFSKQLDNDTGSMHLDLVKGEATSLLKQYHSEVDDWMSKNPYHDQFDGQTYPYATGYQDKGLGGDMDVNMGQAQSANDYQGMIDEINNARFNFDLLKQNFGDKTPSDKPHETDKKLLDHYKLGNRQVLMVSMIEQTMRVYENGKLVKVIPVTTGRYERPSEPGVFGVLDRQSPFTFKSSDPKDSPFWYPDSKANYAILYEAGGYFVHDAPWRSNYGPGTQFPHDDGGAPTGSHGCINLSTDNEGWVYSNTGWNTIVAIY